MNTNTSNEAELNSEHKKALRTAVLQLRTSLGLTQTQFGNRLGKGLATIQRYETLVPPKGPVLVQLMNLAAEINENSIAEIFRSALSLELGYIVESSDPGPVDTTPDDQSERAEVEVLLEILRNPEMLKEREEWNRLSAPVKDLMATTNMLKLRNDAIWYGGNLAAKLGEARSKGILSEAIMVKLPADLLKITSALREKGRTDDEIAQLLGLKRQEP